MTDDLSAQGSGLRARQTKGSPHAPGKTHSDASSKPQIVDLHFLAQGRKKRAVCLWARRYSIRSSSPWMRPDVETIAGRKA